MAAWHKRCGRQICAHAQAYEVPASFHGGLSPAVTAHHTRGDLPLLLLPLPPHARPPPPPARPSAAQTSSRDLSAPAPASPRTPSAGPDGTPAGAEPGSSAEGGTSGTHKVTPPGAGVDEGFPRGSGEEPEGVDMEGPSGGPGDAGGYDSEKRVRQAACALLVPCRTAMRGHFPLNGTYFQVNEVFLDDTTLHCPIQVLHSPASSSRLTLPSPTVTSSCSCLPTGYLSCWIANSKVCQACVCDTVAVQCVLC